METYEYTLATLNQPAPDFTAPALVEGEITSVRLSDYRGKWVVLFFYPGDFTFVCPTELVMMAERYAEFKANNTEVLSMSIDSPYVHLAWQNNELREMVKGGLPYPMLTDKGGVVGEMYGVYDAEAGVDLRGTFIIDPEGLLKAIYILPDSAGRDVNEIIRILQSLQYTYEHKGEATPACWRPGGDTLKPGAELVGHVWSSWKKPQ
jgi:peroxiredoxin (alkyl hydroperoxide reductase subunit C)